MFEKIKLYFKDQMKEKIPRRIFIISCVLLVLVFCIIFMRVVSSIILYVDTQKEAIATVSTVKAIHGPGTETIILPGNVQGWHEAFIYARTNGYIKTWLVDIGDYVKEGDLLAEIETPELDEQLRQAEADLKTAEENYKLAQITAARWLFLWKTESVSKQETDEKVSDEKAKKDIVKAALANRDRLNKLVGFERVIAPFDGVITSRTTDIGALINAGSGTYPALFRIAQTTPLRIYVRIPQTYASRIQSDMTVTLHFPSHPGKEFPAKLFQTADAIEPVTRTLLAQFTTENKEHELLPGSYTEVYFNMPIPPEIVRIPVNTLLFRSGGLQVATIDGDHKVVLKPITINRDFGNIVEVNNGIKADEEIILNPPDSIYSGEKVRIVESQDLKL